jgi:prepilin signal peptidase PulO-like enzyme (type II secretory pathway)
MIKKDSLPDVMTIVGYVVATLFIAMGLYMLFGAAMKSIPKEFRNIFGVVVIGYGVFRLVLIYQKSKVRKDMEDEDNL